MLVPTNYLLASLLIAVPALSMDLSAMTEEQIEELDDAVRIQSEDMEEVASTNEGEEGDVQGSGFNGKGGWDYCKVKTCGVGEGDCDANSECKNGLVCGCDNCDQSLGYHRLADCCEKVKPFHKDYCKYNQCGKGEGDCDCHAECAPGFKCGVNNCRRMNPGIPYIKKWADCCTPCSTVKVGPVGMRTAIPAEFFENGVEKLMGAERNLYPPRHIEAVGGVWNLPALGATDEIKIKCCKFGRKQCHFFISVYHCKPCSENHDGGLPQYLPNAGWDTGSCSPKFELPTDTSGTTHAMTNFHRMLHPGESEIIPLSKSAPHVAIFERVGVLSPHWCPVPAGPFPPGPPCVCIPALE